MQIWLLVSHPHPHAFLDPLPTLIFIIDSYHQVMILKHNKKSCESLENTAYKFDWFLELTVQDPYTMDSHSSGDGSYLFFIIF